MRSRRPRSAPPKTKPIASSGRIVPSRSGSSTAEEAAALPLRKEPARVRAAPADRRSRISICRRAAARTSRGPGRSASSRSAAGRSCAAALASSSSAADRALIRFREWRDSLSAATRHLSVTPPELASAIERLQGDAKSQQRTLRGLQEQLAVHEGRALVVTRRARGERDRDRRSARGLGRGRAEGDGRRRHRCEAPSAAVALFSQTQPGAGRRRARRREPGRCRSGAQGADRPLRRQGRRKAGDGAGRRARRGYGRARR